LDLTWNEIRKGHSEGSRGNNNSEQYFCGKLIVKKKYGGGIYKGKKKMFAKLKIPSQYQHSVSFCIQSTGRINSLTRKSSILPASTMPYGDLLPAINTRYRQQK